MNLLSKEASRGMDTSFNQDKTVRVAPSKHTKSLKGHEVFSAKADYGQLLSTNGLEDSDHESWKSFGAKQPDESAASVGKYMDYSELLAIYQSSVGLVQPPSSSMPFVIQALVKMHNSPGFDDPLVIDKYFFCLLYTSPSPRD